MGGGKKAGKKAQPAKGRKKSGNPLKRAQEEQAAAERRALGPAGAQAPDGGAFGLGAGKGPADFELPKEFKDLL